MMFLGALFVVTGLLGQQDAAVSEEVAREWRVRSLALGQEAWPDEITEIAWEERCILLDAARRADPASLDDRAAIFVVESLGDSQSNVRALALAAARRMGLGLPEGLAEELARDLLPEVRMELATTLCAESDPHLRVWSHGESLAVAEVRAAEARFVLLDLALDADTYVKRRATAGLLSLGAVALEEQLTWWLSAGVERDTFEFLRALETLSRGPSNPELARFGRGRFAEAGDLSRAALWETCVDRLGLSMREDILALGWTASLEESEGAEALRVGRLQDAAHKRGSQLAQILLSASRNEPSERVRRALAAGVAHAMDLDDTRLLERLALTDPQFASWTWQELFGRVDVWNSEQIGPWLHPSVEAELRDVAFNAVTETLTRTGDLGARVLTEALLRDEKDPLFDVAFRALCDAPDPGRSLSTLHEAWRKTAEPRRGQLLRSLSREVIPTPFREDLLQRWRPKRARDASSLELLATFVDDEGVARAVCAYLAEHVSAFEESSLTPNSELEGRLLSLISASRRLCAGEVLGLWDRALAAGALRSKEVVKAAGAALAGSREGQLVLAHWVEMEAPSRARIEAAVLVCELRPVEATRVILERFQLCDPPLRVRALRALGRAETGAAQRFLEGVAVGVGLDAQVAIEAIANSSLSALGRVASMKRIASESKDLEVVRTAIEGLATAGSSQLTARERAGEALVEFTSISDASIGSLRDDLLLAFARLGVEGDTFASLYLDLPLANASSEMEARFRGGTLSSREFLYRGDLRSTAQLAELGSLAGSRWSGLLEDASGVLDGRLLLQLADAARGGGPGDVTARRLLVAAAIALEGEPVNAELELDRARVYASLLSIDLKQSQFKSAAAWASRLGRDWKLGVLSERDLQLLLGGRGTDPEPQAFLPASALQAQALLAMAEGRIDAARALAERGREVAGRSSRALEHQAILDAALETAR
jgi:hypothetical protein